MRQKCQVWSRNICVILIISTIRKLKIKDGKATTTAKKSSFKHRSVKQIYYSIMLLSCSHVVAKSSTVHIARFR